MKRLETERLILREFRMSDLDDFYAYAKHPLIGPMAGWKPHDSIEETLGVLTSFLKKKEVWAIVDKESKTVIGSVGIHKTSVNDIYSLGYVLSHDYWGKGLIVEACKELIEHVFDTYQIDTLEVRHFASNTRSKRVIEKLGFTYQEYIKEGFTMYNGVKQDSLRYTMERDEYNAKTKGNL